MKLRDSCKVARKDKMDIAIGYFLTFEKVFQYGNVTIDKNNYGSL